MALPPSGTFDYVALVADARETWTAALCTPIEPTGDDLVDNRLVGYAPTLDISDAGMPAEVRVSPFTGTVRPRVLRSRLTLTATDRKHASVASVAVHIDRALAGAMVPSDKLFIARTHGGGLGLSIVRAGQLVAAVGAVSAVALGGGVHARFPTEAVKEAESAFRKYDPEFELREVPVEIRAAGHTCVLDRARRRLGPYEIFAEHGFYRDEAGGDECVAIWRVGTCSDVAAIASAQLLDDSHALEMKGW
jgi:hypothetical protein